MKHRSLLITAASFIGMLVLFGCQNEGARLTAPDELAASDSPVFIELPNEQDLAKSLYAESEITRQDGGEVRIWYRSSYSNVKVYMKLEFDPGSVSNDFTASLGTDTKYLTTDMALTFGPHGTYFLKPARLTMRVSGLDLSVFKSKDYDRDGITYLALYYTSDGKWQKMNGSMKLNLVDGTLECYDVELPHFSRYAFGT
jgi:hypothetical protein